MTVEGADAGLHFLLRVASPASEERLVAAARQEGVALAPLSAFRLGGEAGAQDGDAAGGAGDGKAPGVALEPAVPADVRVVRRQLRRPSAGVGRRNRRRPRPRAVASAEGR